MWCDRLTETYVVSAMAARRTWETKRRKKVVFAPCPQPNSDRLALALLQSDRATTEARWRRHSSEASQPATWADERVTAECHAWVQMLDVARMSVRNISCPDGRGKLCRMHAKRRSSVAAATTRAVAPRLLCKPAKVFAEKAMPHHQDAACRCRLAHLGHCEQKKVCLGARSSTSDLHSWHLEH